jgi:hypothetical protein
MVRIEPKTDRARGIIGAYLKRVFKAEPEANGEYFISSLPRKVRPFDRAWLGDVVLMDRIQVDTVAEIDWDSDEVEMESVAEKPLATAS